MRSLESSLLISRVHPDWRRLRKNRALGAGIAVRRPGDRLFRCRWEGFRKSAGTEADQHPERTVVLFGNHGFIKIGGGSFLRQLFESTSSHCPKTRNRDSGFRPSRRRRGACGRRTGPLGGSGGSPGRCCGVRSRPGLRIRILADDYPELSGAGPLSENGDSAGAHPVGEPHPELNIDCRDVLFPRALNKQERCTSPLGWRTFIKRSV